MNTQTESTAPKATEYSDEKGSDSSLAPPTKVEDVERSAASDEIDAAAEARVIRKLDLRIVPMICWIYLMNFMDRGLSILSDNERFLTRSQSTLEMPVSMVWRKISTLIRVAISFSLQSLFYSSPTS